MLRSSSLFSLRSSMLRRRADARPSIASHPALEAAGARMPFARPNHGLVARRLAERLRRSRFQYAHDLLAVLDRTRLLQRGSDRSQNYDRGRRCSVAIGLRLMSTATIISDASHCHWSKTGGWAGWAKADGKASQTWSGNFKSAVQSSVEAELFAIANVLFSATTSGYLPDYSDVLIQSDCTWPLTRDHESAARDQRAQTSRRRRTLPSWPKGEDFYQSRRRAHSDHEPCPLSQSDNRSSPRQRPQGGRRPAMGQSRGR